MTDDVGARMRLQRELTRRVTTSVFDGKGRVRDDAQSFASDGRVELGEYIDMSAIPFAPDPDGSDHCANLARLVEYMSTLPRQVGGLGPLEVRDQRALHAVAMLYCVGKGTMKNGALVDVKGTPVDKPFGEVGYEQRSASFAESFFRNGGAVKTSWAKQDMWQDVCHLIAKHNDPKAIAEDVRLKIFADALRYELVRIKPNTAEGLALIKRECAPDKFHMGWSKDRANFRTWMMNRGWK